ncbi:MAG: hypothetical protein PG981_000913 [Wolbachia endosymbiont of Ctenocephalides orientis wCori]|nr:MAG: hypothetical protein PG981_000913 [Wolbachia endosymbiont of Ctenocephalides orientis wCori]
MYYLKQILPKISIKKITIEHNLAKNIYEICEHHGNNFCLIADENTAKLLSKNILSKITQLIIPGNSIASTEIVSLVRSKAKNSDLIVAFGSGTISDVCKYTSYLEKKIMYCFPRLLL